MRSYVFLIFHLQMGFSYDGQRQLCIEQTIIIHALFCGNIINSYKFMLEKMLTHILLVCCSGAGLT